jgi:Domain of unknown function (DUF4365)/Domain of unknown function (DUF4263)
MSPPELGRLGTAAVALAVARDLGWVFREQPFDDYGIDALVEIIEDGFVSGKLFALQIKSGLGSFRNLSSDGWWYHPSTSHALYWKNHSVPVVIVLYNPETGTCYWQVVSHDSLKSTQAGGWEMLIPKDQVLNENARGPLMDAVVHRQLRTADNLREQSAQESDETWQRATESTIIKDRRRKIAELMALAMADRTTETNMHEAIGNDYWIFGSDFISIAPRRNLALLDEYDYPLLRADGGLHIVELKGTAERIVEKHRNHYIVSANVHRAVSQCINYLRALDEQGAMLQTTYRNELNLDIDFRRVGGTVVIGHLGRNEASSPPATKPQIEQTIRSYNAHIARIQVVTYSDLLGSAGRALRF